ncbi:Alpha/Beta hydrolase protein [Mycena sp. CBHHK59/15]|nr:Alpha/Beta hydrolase protein [Mycena sp. CBHHK59/15]
MLPTYQLPVLVALHYCGGSASAYFGYTNSHPMPTSLALSSIPRRCTTTTAGMSRRLPRSSTTPAETPLVSSRMVNYTLSKYNTDPSRVFTADSSFGAMIANVFAVVYPDIIKTAQESADLVYAAYTSYTGSYPKMQIWHGTSDPLVSYNDFGEQLKQWSQVHDVSLTRNITGTPSSTCTEMVYGDGTLVQGCSQQGGGHPTPVQEPSVLVFFGINSSSPPVSSTSGSSSAGTSTTTSSAPGATQAIYGQCGGHGWTGPTVCASSTTGKFFNQGYSQCLP